MAQNGIKKHKDKYADELIGRIKIVDDFSPKPKDLVLKVETSNDTYSQLNKKDVKVT